MIYALAGLCLLGLIFGPTLWVKYVLRKHHKPMPGMPGTGAELAQHLLREYNFENVKVEKSEPNNDYYSPSDNAVRLSPEVYDGKSLTAVAVAAHEVGHALQFNRQDPVSSLRARYLGAADRVQRVGLFVLMILPLAALIFRLPHLMVLTAVIGVMTMLASVLLHAAVLPEEWDASFNKALPILEKGQYVPAEYLPAIRQVLKACALTYVAAALADVLRLWRWVHWLR